MNIGMYKKDTMPHLSRLWIEWTEVVRSIHSALYTVVSSGHETITIWPVAAQLVDAQLWMWTC